MRYLVLLYANEAEMPAPGTPEFDADMVGYMAFGELAGPAILAGEALELSATSRTIRHDGTAVQVTAGPFAETAEVLGGMYVLEAPTLDDAIELVRHIPVVSDGAIEIRPMVMWSDRSAELGAVADGAARYLATIHGPQTEAHRRRARTRPELAGHRLAGHRGPLRPARVGHGVAPRRAEPGGGRVVRRRSRCRVAAPRRARR